MRKILLAFAFLPLFALKSFSQDICGTPAIINIENVKRLSSPQKRSANSNYILTVYFHVIRTSSGTGGVTTSNVTSAYNRLNQDFNSHGIYFNWNGVIDYIDNNTYYYNSPDTCTSIFNVNNHINGIDIYLYPAWPIFNYDYVGSARGIGMYSELYVVGSVSGTPACTTSTISHEMGHVLNLWHTHHGTYNEGGNDNPCPELVNGSNSSTCGDYVEDTPADPNLSGKVNSNCVYTGLGTDANNQAYAPDVDLIMSYAKDSCRTCFSTKQGERMRDAIENLPDLMNTRYYPSISGPSYIIQSTSSGVYSISNLSSLFTVEWSLSNDYYNQYHLQQNTPSQNQCTITRDNLYDLMNGTLTAVIKYNGDTIQTLTKTGLYVYNGFRGQYTSGNLSGYIDYTQLFYVRPNVNTYVYSQSLVGATASYDNTATIPNYWGFSSQYGYLQFIMPSNNNGIPVVINITDAIGGNYQLYAVPQNYKSLNISSDENSITITLNEDGDSERGLILDQTWTVEIRNATTGALMAHQSSVSRSTTIATSGWPKGIYVVKATIGKEVLTEKVIVI